MVAVPLAMVPVAIWRAASSRLAEWWLLAGWLVAYVAVAIWQLRFSTFAGLLGLIVALATVSRVLEPRAGDTTPARLGRLALTALALGGLLVSGPLLAAALPAQPAGASSSACSPWELSNDPAFLALGTVPLNIAADVDFGPELLYRTPHNVIAAPYGSRGILDAWDLLAAPPGPAAMDLIRRREVDLILLCPAADPGLRPADPKGTLYEALETGQLPSWATEIPLETDGFRLFRVDRGLIFPAHI
jgi:hypothetical protein